MPENNTNNNNILPTENVVTDLKFGANQYEIGLGSGTREAIEGVFADIDENFQTLSNIIEENEETISTSLNDLETRKANKSEIPTVPTNVSAFTNDVGYLTQHQDISDYFNDVAYDSQTKRINFKNGNTIKKYIDATDFIKDGMIDSVEIDDVTIDNVLTKCLVITFNTDAGKEDINIPLSNIFDPDEYYTKDEIDDSEKVISSALNELQTNKLDASEMSNYYTKTEVDNKGYLTTQVQSDWNQTNINEPDYIKNKPSVVDYVDEDNPNAVTSGAVYDAITENEEIISNSLIDLEERKADKTDIPTIANIIEENNTNPVSSGAVYDAITENEFAISSALNDLDNIKANKSEVATKQDKIAIVNHGTSDTTFTLTPNTYHVWGEVSSLTLTLGTEESGYLNEFMFEFQSGSTATTLSLPNTIKWPMPPTIVANKTYQVNIVNNIGLILGVSTT